MVFAFSTEHLILACMIFVYCIIQNFIKWYQSVASTAKLLYKLQGWNQKAGNCDEQTLLQCVRLAFYCFDELIWCSSYLSSVYCHQYYVIKCHLIINHHHLKCIHSHSYIHFDYTHIHIHDCWVFLLVDSEVPMWPLKNCFILLVKLGKNVKSTG